MLQSVRYQYRDFRLTIAECIDGIFHRFAHGIEIAAECFCAPFGKCRLRTRCAVLAYVRTRAWGMTVNGILLISPYDIPRVRVREREGWGVCITPESTLSPMPGFVFLLAMFGSFLCCFNSPAIPAVDEIRVQQRHVVSDAPEAWFFWGGLSWISPCFCFCGIPIWCSPKGRSGEREKGSYHERERLHFSFRGSAFTVADCRFVFGDAEMHSEDCLKKCSLTVSI